MKLSFLLLVPLLFFTFIAKAQPPARILFNSSFEEPVIAGSNSVFFNENLVPGWDVANANPAVEFWSDGFQGVFAQEGRQHIELNADDPSDVFLDVCLLNGETVTLTFHHRARIPNNNDVNRIDVMEIAAFNAADIMNPNIVLINNATITATNVPDGVLPIPNTWVGSGTIGLIGTNSFQANSPTFGWTRFSCALTNTGASGACRIRFRGIGGGSYGNFIDNVQIGGLNPLTEFSSATYSDIEATGGNLPMLLINGRVDAPGATVEVLISNGTAISPADYTITGTRIINIPAGDYDGTTDTGISIPLGIVNENDLEANETISLSLRANSETGNIVISDADCNNNPILASTYTIINDDVILPVTFTEWKLDDRECGKVKLEWKTAQELNSNYFEVQFSEEGKEWKTIAKLTAKGTSNRTNDYSFVHQTNYKSGYYRLNQVDFNGSSSLTHVISSKQDCDKESNYFKFYPNPKSSNQDLALEFYSTSTSLNYTIIDALGRQISTNTISTASNQFVKQHIQENLSKGLYLIKFWQNDKEVYQTKLIVH